MLVIKMTHSYYGMQLYRRWGLKGAANPGGRAARLMCGQTTACEKAADESGICMPQVGLKGEPPILEGELPFDVRPDDSMWNLSDGRLLEVSLAKQDRMRWWPHVLTSEPQINIQKVRNYLDLCAIACSTAVCMFLSMRCNSLLAAVAASAD